MKTTKRKNTLLAASVAGLLAVGSFAAGSALYAADVACSGVNACKGMGDCGGKGNSCAGKNACKGQGWLNFPSEDLCTKVGGTVVPAAH